MTSTPPFWSGLRSRNVTSSSRCLGVDASLQMFADCRYYGHLCLDVVAQVAFMVGMVAQCYSSMLAALLPRFSSNDLSE